MAGFVSTLAALVLLTGLVSPGLEAWPASVENLARHMGAPMANLIGLTSALSLRLGTPARAVAFVAVPAAALAVAVAPSRRDRVGAAVLGIALVFVGLYLTAYYYVLLVLLMLSERDRPLVVAGAFAVEAAIYALALLEGSTAFLYAHRSLLVLALLAAVCAGPLRAAIRRPAAAA